ncbi:hypothetical protein MP638_003972 [Amoeboaphelidium occidentale]|nr:hypothetical protein MP638_003972 [Amoeboaphelidium occidentale]
MIFKRIFSWFANEFIVKSLANSKTFQNIAHKTHKHVSSIQAQTLPKRPAPARPSNPYRISEYNTTPEPVIPAFKVDKFVNTFVKTLSSEIKKRAGK